MKMFAGLRLALHLGMVAALAFYCEARADAQDPDLPATFGQATLQSGFTPDPHVAKLTAGGDIETKLGGQRAWVAKAPDYKLTFTPGKLPLTFYVESDDDTTLLINLPDGTWVADDDSGGGTNPLLRFANPQEGRYDIWVGTFGKDTAPATLKITELK